MIHVDDLTLRKSILITRYDVDIIAQSVTASYKECLCDSDGNVISESEVKTMLFVNRAAITETKPVLVTEQIQDQETLEIIQPAVYEDSIVVIQPAVTDYTDFISSLNNDQSPLLEARIKALYGIN